MKFNILTIFPEIFNVLHYGVVSRAFNSNLYIDCYDIRKNAINKHGQIDGKPYGGGEGMLMMAQPLKDTLSEISPKDRGRVIYLSPQGKKLTQKHIINYSKMKSLTLICGRYEGVDQRFIDKYVDEEISIGDFILSGESMLQYVFRCYCKNLPGTIGNEDSIKNDSFSNGLLKGPAYTRPEIFEDIKVPDVLLSGNHSKLMNGKLRNLLSKHILEDQI